MTITKLKCVGCGRESQAHEGLSMTRLRKVVQHDENWRWMRASREGRWKYEDLCPDCLRKRAEAAARKVAQT